MNDAATRHERRLNAHKRPAWSVRVRFESSFQRLECDVIDQPIVHREDRRQRTDRQVNAADLAPSEKAHGLTLVEQLKSLIGQHAVHRDAGRGRSPESKVPHRCRAVSPVRPGTIVDHGLVEALRCLGVLRGRLTTIARPLVRAPAFRADGTDAAPGLATPPLGRWRMGLRAGRRHRFDADALRWFDRIGFCCRGVASTYRVVVGRSEEITGPYVDQSGRSLLEGGGTELLSGYDRFAGPGHGDIYVDGSTIWYAHHYYDRTDGGAPKLSVREITWDQGWPSLGEPLSSGT